MKHNNERFILIAEVNLSQSEKRLAGAVEHIDSSNESPKYDTKQSDGQIELFDI